MNKTNKDSLTQFEILEQKLDIPARYVIYSLATCLVLVFFGYMEIQITNVVGIVFPIYWTIKSIEQPEKDDDKQWLSYWAIFISSLFIDATIGYYLEMIPYLYFLKLCFLIWLFLPNTKGALILHENIIRNYFILDTSNLRIQLNRFSENVKEFAIDIMESIKDIAEQVIQIPASAVEKAEDMIDSTVDAVEKKLLDYTDQPIKDFSEEESGMMERPPSRDNGKEETIAEEKGLGPEYQQQHGVDSSDLKRRIILESDEPRKQDLIDE
jgi:receptor expression-enhancing protein 5/6